MDVDCRWYVAGPAGYLRGMASGILVWMFGMVAGEMLVGFTWVEFYGCFGLGRVAMTDEEN